MLRLGLCSGALITRSPRDVITAAMAAGLDAIEWSGELFASGDRDAAWGILMETLRSGLTIASYSSLYRAGSGEDHDARFERALEAASMLNAPNLRIFAGFSPADRGESSRRSALVEELGRLGDLAAGRGITLCLSFGRHTGLEGYPDALGLLAEVDHPFVRLAWEPLPGRNAAEASAALDEAGPAVALLVARALDRGGASRALAEDAGEWHRRLEAYKKAEPDPKMGRFILIGSVREGEGDAKSLSLAEDAALLRGIVSELEAKR